MLKFEWRYFIRQPSFFVISLIMFIFPFLSVTVEGIQIGVQNSNIMLNSPYSISLTMLIMGFFGMFLVVNFVANTAIRNDTMMISELLYTKPINHLPYQLGRFFGAYLIVLLVSLMVPLGLLFGSLMPWVDSESLGPISLINYLAPYLIFTVPTCFVLSCLFYAAAIRFRSMLAVYLFALVLFALYGISGSLVSGQSWLQVMAIADPFGLRAFFELSKYWSPAEKNSNVVNLVDVILYNRLVWIAIALIVLLGVGRIFEPLTWKGQKDNKFVRTDDKPIPLDNDFNFRYGKNAHLSQFTSLLRFEVKQIMFSPGFIIVLLISAILVISQFVSPQGQYGAVNYPLTQYMVELIQNAFSFALVIVITFYSAEVAWRERSTGIGDIVDSLPLQNFTIWLSKLLAVWVVILSLLFIGMVSTLANQLVSGFYSVDLFQYAISLFYFIAPQWMLFTVLAFLIHALSPNKYVGMMIFVVFMFVPFLLSGVGIEHNMYNYAAFPFFQFSDMNQYGWLLTSQHFYLAYWASIALVIAAFSFALWQRGPESSLHGRLSNLSFGLGKLGQTLVVIGFVSFISLGTVIHYNTTVLNQHLTSSDVSLISAEYEKAFAQYEDANIPSTTAVKLDVAIFPKLRKLEAIAQVSLQNRSDNPIESVLINYPNHSSIEIIGAKIQDYNGRFKTAWMSFHSPLLPGEKVDITMSVTRMHRGFKDKKEDTQLVKNGTFITNTQMLPTFGVNRSSYLQDPALRRQHDLPELIRAYPLEDSSRYNTGLFGKNASKIDFSATLSTSEDQIAIAPGYLQKYWTEGGRNYFVYEMDIPMHNFYNIMSADYSVKSVMHNDIEIAVYYHPEHKWNVDRMIESTKDSLDFYSKTFGAYQHKQLRIVEFPGYLQYAQSFANTVPYSERIGFITDLREQENIDLVYYVTAHEVAHQWFGHQLHAADVQGARILSEALAQYAALQVMQNKYGEAKIRHFLTYELDKYLQGRASEAFLETPFMKEEGQAYIYYDKASIVMMAIADRMGSDNLNRAIRSLLERFKENDQRLPTTLDLLAILKKFSNEEHHAFIDQQFSQITLYDIRLESVAVDTDKQVLALDVLASQVAADGEGNESKQVFSDYVDIVFFSDDPTDFDKAIDILYKKRHWLEDGLNTITIDLSKLNNADAIQYVGVDPFIRYIDRNSKDNIQKL